MQGVIPLRGKLPADPSDWRAGSLCFCTSYISQEAQLHGPVPGAASLKVSSSLTAWPSTSNSWEMDSQLWFNVSLHRTWAKQSAPAATVRARHSEHTACLLPPCLHASLRPSWFSWQKCQYWLREQNTSATICYPVLLPTAQTGIRIQQVSLAFLTCPSTYLHIEIPVSNTEAYLQE